MKVTLREVALQAGVSISTASRALSQDADNSISPETASRIRRIAQQLGYISRSARKNGQPHYRIGRILWSPTDPFCVELARGMETEGVAKPASIVLTLNGSDLKRPWAVEQLRQSNLHGLIAVDLFPETEVERVVKAAGDIPLVRIDIARMSAAHDQVCIDTVHAIGMAVEHLADLGYRRIAFIGGQQWGDDPANELRTVGFRAAMARCGLEVIPEWVLAEGWTAKSGYRGMLKLLSMAERPEAVVTGGDRIAIGAISAASDRGLHVPQDIAITGFDDIEIAAFSRPPLSTVAIPKLELGDMAVRLLIQRIEGLLPSFSIRVVLPTRMVVRESSGAHLKRKQA